MQTLIMVQIPPTSWYWRDLRDGYVILGDVTIARPGSFEGTLTPDPDIAYLDPRTGMIHRYRAESDGQPGHFEFDVDEIVDLLGYPDLNSALTRYGIVRVRFDMPTDAGLRRLTERCLEEAFGIPADVVVETIAREQGVQVGGRILKDLLVRLTRIGHGKAGGIQVHDLIPNLAIVH